MPDNKSEGTLADVQRSVGAMIHHEIVLDIFRHSEDFFLRGDVDQPDNREIDVHLNVTMPIVLVVVVDLDTLDQRKVYRQIRRLQDQIGNSVPLLINPPAVFY